MWWISETHFDIRPIALILIPNSNITPVLQKCKYLQMTFQFEFKYKYFKYTSETIPQMGTYLQTRFSVEFKHNHVECKTKFNCPYGYKK